MKSDEPGMYKLGRINSGLAVDKACMSVLSLSRSLSLSPGFLLIANFCVCVSKGHNPCPLYILALMGSTMPGYFPL